MNTGEEPKYYPPQSMRRVEFCKKCGMVIIPIEYRDYHGENFASGKEVKPLLTRTVNSR